MTERFRFRDARGLRASITRRSQEKTVTTTLERVRKIIVDYLEVEPEKVTETASFIDDLGADSLDFVEITMACEEEFDIEISDDDAETFKTAADVVKWLDAKLAEPA